MVLIQLILLSLLFNIYTYFSLYLHEVGHLISAKLLGAKYATIVWNWKKSNPITRFSFGRKINRLENLIITLAGVVIQLILTLILVIQNYSLIIKLISIIYIPGILVNLLPIKPLDGSYLVSSCKNILYLTFYLSIPVSLYFTWKIVSIIWSNSLLNMIIIMIFPILKLCKLLLRIRRYRSLSYANKI